MTVTGGEPLLQPVFTGEILRRCKEAGLHTALDTSGFLGARATDELLADTDLVLLDIKSFDVPAYRQLTGGELAPTLNFATRLDRLGIPTWIRYVLVPGWTDARRPSPASPASSRASATSTGWTSCPSTSWAPRSTRPWGSFPLRDTPVPEPGLTERVREQFRECGLAAY